MLYNARKIKHSILKGMKKISWRRLPSSHRSCMLIFGCKRILYGLPVVAAAVCRWPWQQRSAFRLPNNRTHLWHSRAAGSTDSKWEWEVRSFLSVALAHLSSRYVHTHASGPTHAQKRDATLGSRSGDCQWKRNFVSHTRQFLQISSSLRVVFLSPPGWV